LVSHLSLSFHICCFCSTFLGIRKDSVYGDWCITTLYIHVPSLHIHIISLIIHIPSLYMHIPSLYIHIPSLYMHIPSLYIHIPSLYIHRRNACAPSFASKNFDARNRKQRRINSSCRFVYQTALPAASLPRKHFTELPVIV
jgi:hypothetical protein